MSKTTSVIIAIVYLLAILSAICFAGFNLLSGILFVNSEYTLLCECVLLSGIGGILYCLRGTYLNFCVKDNWDNKWIVWYLVRPVASLICGGVSYLFLKAGLLVLEAQKETSASNLGFLAFAFIAGLNVDKFISKIEELAKATWGIEKSKSSSQN